MELQQAVDTLCASLPEAIGAIVCDFEGEAVVWAVGAATPPEGAERNALSRIPRALQPTMPWVEFLLRISGAEPCALLRLFGERSAARGVGGIVDLDLRFEAIDLLVRALPEDYYVMLALRRPALAGLARDSLDRARKHLATLIL